MSRCHVFVFTLPSSGFAFGKQSGKYVNQNKTSRTKNDQEHVNYLIRTLPPHGVYHLPRRRHAAHRQHAAASAVGNLQQLCLHVLEPLRAHLGHAVRINSGYRSPKLNAAVGGVKTSDHTRGCAADIFIPDAKTGREWFVWMMDNLEFDQLIWETASAGKACWIHVGYRGTGRNRQQVVGHLVKR